MELTETTHETESPFLTDQEMVVWELYLPGYQAAALEKAASSRGITVGQLVRGLIRDYFSRFARPWHSDLSNVS